MDKIINFTDAAIAHIKENLQKNSAKGIRFSVKFGGCQGLTYGVDYVEEINAADITFEYNGISVFLEPKAVLFLEGMVVDFKTTAISSGFVFENPNAQSKCGCGMSFCSKDVESSSCGSCNGTCCR